MSLKFVIFYRAKTFFWRYFNWQHINQQKNAPDKQSKDPLEMVQILVPFARLKENCAIQLLLAKKRLLANCFKSLLICIYYIKEKKHNEMAAEFRRPVVASWV